MLGHDCCDFARSVPRTRWAPSFRRILHCPLTCFREKPRPILLEELEISDSRPCHYNSWDSETAMIWMTVECHIFSFLVWLRRGVILLPRVFLVDIAPFLLFRCWASIRRENMTRKLFPPVLLTVEYDMQIRFQDDDWFYKQMEQ